MPDANSDANNAGTSSQPANTQTDANQSAGGTSTNAQNPAAKQDSPSLQDVIGKAIGHVGTSATPGTANSQAAPISQTGQSQGQGDPAKADAAKTGEDQQKEELPFHNHPRWKEVVSERDAFKGENESLKAQNAQYQEAFGQLNHYMADTGMSNDEFNQTLNLAALFKKGDMAGFLKLAMPLVQQAQMFTGEFLPADIQARVDAGTLDVESAKQLVTAQATAAYNQQKLQEHNQRMQMQQQQQLQQQQQQQQQQQMQQLTTAFETAHNNWLATNRATDPGFANLERAIMSEAFLVRSSNPQAYTTPQAWVGLLEQTKKTMIDQVLANRNGSPKAITPTSAGKQSTFSGATQQAGNASNSSLRQVLEAVVGPSVG